MHPGSNTRPSALWLWKSTLRDGMTGLSESSSLISYLNGSIRRRSRSRSRIDLKLLSCPWSPSEVPVTFFHNCLLWGIKESWRRRRAVDCRLYLSNGSQKTSWAIKYYGIIASNNHNIFSHHTPFSLYSLSIILMSDLVNLARIGLFLNGWSVIADCFCVPCGLSFFLSLLLSSSPALWQFHTHN